MKMGKRCPALVQSCNPWGLLQTYFILISLCVTTISASYQAQSNILPGDMEPSSFTSSSTPSSPPTAATYVMECCRHNRFADDHCWLDDNTLVIVDGYAGKVVKATVNRNTKNCTYSVFNDSPAWPFRVACSPDGEEIYVLDNLGIFVWVYDRTDLKALWKPEGVVGPLFNVAMNSNIVIIGTGIKGPLYVYDRNRVYQGQISISQNQFMIHFTHLTEEGVFVATTYYDHKLVIYDIPNNSTIIAGGTGSGDGQLDGPSGVTTVVDYILVCDALNYRVPVFSLNGEFQSNLQFKGAGISFAATIDYRSETKLLSLNEGQSLIRIYSLS